MRMSINPIMRGKFKRAGRGLYYWTQCDGTVWVIEHVTRAMGFSENEWHVGTESDPHADQYGTFSSAVNSLVEIGREDMSYPVVGKGATLCYPGDRYPYVIVAISKTGKKITMLELSSDARIVPGIKAGEDHISSHYYTESEIADPAIRTDQTLVAYRNKRGEYVAHKCIGVSIGVARYRRDWSD